MKRIASVGSLNVDWVLRVPRFPAPGETLPGESLETHAGGKGANQAAAAARLGPSVSVALIGQVGADSHGTWLREQLVAQGVDVTAVRVDAAVQTGCALVAVDAGGQNRIVIVAGANGSFTLERFAQVAAQPPDYLLLQNEIPATTVTAVARWGRAGGSRVIYDPAPTRTLEHELLGLCDYLTPNESELLTLLGDPPGDGTGISVEAAKAGARRLHEQGARNVIVKLGKRGALLVGDSGEEYWPPLVVTAVDTTAAGDVWNGAFAVALAEGMPLAMAGRFANAAAALSVTRAGAQASIPSRAEVEAML